MNKLNRLIVVVFLSLVSFYSFSVFANDFKNIKLDVYTIEKDGKVSYLVGAFHIINLDAIQEDIKKIITSQDYLVVENIAIGNDSSLLLQENDKKWWNMLKPYEKNALSVLNIENIENYKMDFVFLNLLHWVFAELAKDKNIEYEDQKEQSSFESSLEKIYPKDKTFGLEVFDEANAALSKAELSEHLNDFDAFKRFIMAAHDLQESKGDVRKIIMDFYREKYGMIGNFEKSNNAEETAYDPVVDERNLLWVDRIENFHKTLNGSVIFVVGRGHLYSNLGLLKLLADRDFKITKLTFDSTDSDKIDL